MFGRSLLRMVRSTFGQFLAIFAIIALGTGFFIGLRVAHDAMLVTADDYLSESSFGDFRLVSTLGLTEEDAESFRGADGVLRAEGSVSADALFSTGSGSDMALHVHTLLPSTNRAEAVSGRLPIAADEIVLDATYFGGNWIGREIALSDLNDGDTKDLFARNRFRVVGTVNSPEYINFERGSTKLGSGSVAGFAYVLAGAFDADYYTEIWLTMADMPPAATDEYKDAAEAMEDGLKELLEERGRIRYASLKAEAEEKIGDAQSEIDDGWTQIADANTEIADARKKLADAARELADARKELDDGWAEYADGERELEDAAAELADARKELDDGWAEYNDGLADYEDGRKKYEDGLADYGEGKKKYEDGLAKYEDGLAEYERGVREYEDGEAEADAALADARAKLDGVKATLEASRAELDGAKATLEASRAELDNGAAALAKLRSELDGAIVQKQTIEAGLPYLTGDELAAAQTALATLTAQIAYGEAQYAAGAAKLNDGEAGYAAGLAQYNEGEAQYAAGLAQYNAGEEAYRTNALAAANELAAARRKLDDAAAELADAKQELDDAAAELTDAEAELADAKQELDDAETELTDAKQKLDDGEAEYADGLAEYEKGVRELADAKQELEDGEREYAKGLREYRTKSREAEETIAGAEADIAKAEKDLTEGQEKVDDARTDLDALEEPTVYVLGRDTNIGYVAVENDTAIVRGIAKVFPLFFFAVSALVCITTMTRMIDEQRTENGTLKALGFSDGRIIGRYLIYAGTASLLGCLSGFFVGSRYMPMAIWKIYRIMYSMDRPVAYVLDWKLFAVCTALYILLALGTTWFVCHKDLTEPAAELIRPKAPEPGKRVLLERIPFIWKRLGFLRKVSVRNIFLYKKRMIMMIIGIGGCTALLLAGLGISDTIKPIVDLQYEEISVYDATVTFDGPVPAEGEAAFRSECGDLITDAAFIRLETMNIHKNGAEQTNVVTFREPLDGFFDLHAGSEPVAWPGKGEAVIDFRLARSRNISVGDTVTLTDDDYRTLTVTVTGIFDNYLYDYVFVSEETVRKQFGAEPERKTAYVNFPEGADAHRSAAALLSREDVLSVSLSQDMMTTVDSMLQSMDYVVLIVLISAGALAFIVLYNLTNISITERKREIATLKVLGFFQGETAQYVFRENLILTGIASLFGIPLGILLLRYVMSQVVIQSMYFGCRLAPVSYVLAVAITFVFAVLIDLVLRRKIAAIDMAESMKAIE